MPCCQKHALNGQLTQEIHGIRPEFAIPEDLAVTLIASVVCTGGQGSSSASAAASAAAAAASAVSAVANRVGLSSAAAAAAAAGNSAASAAASASSGELSHPRSVSSCSF